MPLGIIALTILLAMGAVGLTLSGIRLARRIVHLNSIIGLWPLLENSALFVGAIACGIGAVHFFNQIGG